MAGSLESIEARVGKSAELLEEFGSQGTAIKWSALFVKAVALTLDRNPEMHRLVAGNRRLQPDQVDICLSVSAEQAITPVIILEDCARRNVACIASEIVRLTPLARTSDQQMISLLNRWGFLGVTASLRRAIVRTLLNRLWYRRKVSGTFQISVLPGVDTFAPFRFNTAGALGIGDVRARPVVTSEQITIQQTVILTCCFDHSVWNGGDAARFLGGVKQVLETAEFAHPSELKASALFGCPQTVDQH